MSAKTISLNEARRRVGLPPEPSGDLKTMTEDEFHRWARRHQPGYTPVSNREPVAGGCAVVLVICLVAVVAWLVVGVVAVCRAVAG